MRLAGKGRSLGLIGRRKKEWVSLELDRAWLARFIDDWLRELRTLLR